MTATCVFYEGRVQGVGFRWMARDLAKGFDIAGSVRNLTDGRVELIVAGEERDEFLEAIETSALSGHIERSTRSDITLDAPLRGFQIIP